MKSARRINVRIYWHLSTKIKRSPLGISLSFHILCISVFAMSPKSNILTNCESQSACTRKIVPIFCSQNEISVCNFHLSSINSYNTDTSNWPHKNLLMASSRPINVARNYLWIDVIGYKLNENIFFFHFVHKIWGTSQSSGEKNAAQIDFKFFDHCFCRVTFSVYHNHFFSRAMHFIGHFKKTLYEGILLLKPLTGYILSSNTIGSIKIKINMHSRTTTGMPEKPFIHSPNAFQSIEAFSHDYSMDTWIIIIYWSRTE